LHRPNESLHHSAVDSPQCTVPGERTRQVDQVVVDMVWCWPGNFALCPAGCQAVVSPLDLKSVFHADINAYFINSVNAMLLYHECIIYNLDMSRLMNGSKTRFDGLVKCRNNMTANFFQPMASAKQLANVFTVT